MNKITIILTIIAVAIAIFAFYKLFKGLRSFHDDIEDDTDIVDDPEQQKKNEENSSTSISNEKIILPETPDKYKNYKNIILKYNDILIKYSVSSHFIESMISLITTKNRVETIEEMKKLYPSLDDGTIEIILKEVIKIEDLKWNLAKGTYVKR